MNLWQKAMICLATHPKIKQAVENKSLVRELGQRYIGGKDESDLIGKSLDLKSSGMGTSFFCLGEYIRDARVIDQTITSLKTTILLARRVGLDLHTSIDPTQAGLMISKRCCQNNLEDLAYWIKQGARAGSRDLLMMDMEDAAVTRDTLNIFHNLRSQGLPVGITLQACLIRTPGDLGPVMEKSTAVRLVKGAFAEKPKIALQPGNAVDRAYLSLADRLLDPQAIEKGVFPVFATHDPILIKKIIAKAQARKISADQFEFEMLLGVRPELQKNLTNRNFQVRIYLPYGKDIWPYAIRRVGENPKNFKFLIKSILTAK